MKPHVHHFSIWVHARDWIFPSNSLLVKVSPASCDLIFLTSIIWTSLFKESKNFCAGRDASSPIVSSRKLVWIAQDNTAGPARNLASWLPHGSPFTLWHWAPAFYGIKDGGGGGFTKILPTLFQVLTEWPYLIIHISSQISSFSQLRQCYQKTLLVSLHLPHQNDTLFSCLQTNTKPWGLPLSYWKVMLPPQLEARSVHTQNPEGLIRF